LFSGLKGVLAETEAMQFKALLCRQYFKGSNFFKNWGIEFTENITS